MSQPTAGYEGRTPCCFRLDEIHERGVVVPVKRTIYKPILNELKREGISWTEKNLSK